MDTTNHVCKNCGEPLTEDQKFCPKCGTEQTEPPKEELQEGQQEEQQRTICEKCGAELSADQAFCDKCGHKIHSETTSDVPPKNAQNPSTAPKNKKKLFTLIGIAAAVLILVVVLVFTLTSRVNFEKVYDAIDGNSIYCTLASDGSYLKIDTNPYDIDDYFSSSAWTMVQQANEELGFSDSLTEKMGETRAIDGTQTSENNKVSVSWTYHPDNGLEVIYEKR